jgi:hypothetical protein
MAGERKRVMGELATWHAGAILARLPFADTPPDPQADNPYREPAAPSEAAAQLERWKRKRAWRAGLRAMGKGKWKG